MPKRRVIIGSDSDSDDPMPIASKRSRTLQIFEVAETSARISNKTSRPNFKSNSSKLEVKQNVKSIRTNQKMPMENIEIKPQKIVRNPVKSVLKHARRNPSHQRFIEYRRRHKQAFRSFERAVGKFSGVPDFEKTLRKSFDRLKLKRTVYLGAKCRNKKLRYKVLANLYNMSVQRVLKHKNSWVLVSKTRIFSLIFTVIFDNYSDNNKLGSALYTNSLHSEKTPNVS